MDGRCRMGESAVESPGAVNDSMEDFLQNREAGAEETIAWGNGTIPLHISAYLTGDALPLPFVTSVRALMVRGGCVPVFWDEEGTPQLLPGGRREQGETLRQTLERELLDETGVEQLNPVPFGFLRHHHLGPMPAGHTYPFPDFIRAVYLARAGVERPEARIHDPYVSRVAFLPPTEVETLPLRPTDRLFLSAALRKL